jgi:hypothetical protein
MIQGLTDSMIPYAKLLCSKDFWSHESGRCKAAASINRGKSGRSKNVSAADHGASKIVASINRDAPARCRFHKSGRFEVAGSTNWGAPNIVGSTNRDAARVADATNRALPKSSIPQIGTLQPIVGSTNRDDPKN